MLSQRLSTINFTHFQTLLGTLEVGTQSRILLHSFILTSSVEINVNTSLLASYVFRYVLTCDPTDPAMMFFKWSTATCGKIFLSWFKTFCIAVFLSLIFPTNILINCNWWGGNSVTICFRLTVAKYYLIGSASYLLQCHPHFSSKHYLYRKWGSHYFYRPQTKLE